MMLALPCKNHLFQMSLSPEKSAAFLDGIDTVPSTAATSTMHSTAAFVDTVFTHNLLKVLCTVEGEIPKTNATAC